MKDAKSAQTTKPAAAPDQPAADQSAQPAPVQPPQNTKPSGMYGPWKTILITLFVYFSAQILAGLVIYAIPSLKHWTQARQDVWLQNPWVTFVYIIVAEALTLVILYKFMKARKVTFKALGLNKPKAAFIGYTLGAYALYFVVYIVSIIVAKAVMPGLNLDQKQELGFSDTTRGVSLLPVFISLVILPPITEEIVVRGFLFMGLRSKWAFLPAAVLTSLLFAAAHLGEGGGGGLLWVAGIDTFILSLVLCFLREKTGSLWPGIGVHMIKNGIAFVVLYNIFSYIR